MTREEQIKEAAIEERADMYVEHLSEDLKTCCKYSYIDGAKHEREILTRWHDPKKELPDTNRDVLIKTTLCGKYKVAFYKESSQKNYRWHESNGAIDDDMVVGWREIYE